MNCIENQNGISNNQSTRENTHIIQKNSRSGILQYFNNGFGKVRNVDFEPTHYADN